MPCPCVLKAPTAIFPMVTASHIISLLPTLSQGELRSIHLAIEQLLTFPEIDQDLFQAILDLLGRTGSIKLFKQTQAYKVWVKNQPYVDALIKKIIGDRGAPQVVVRRLKRLLVELLIKELSSKGVELSMRNVSQGLAQIETVFDNAFPMYLANGLAYLVIANLGGSNVTEDKRREQDRANNPEN